MTAAPRRLESTLRSFADRLFLTGGRDPGDAALALPPSRLRVYRDLLRGNYGGMLRFALTQSFALMDAELAAANGAGGLPADSDAVVVRFLQVSPSRTHSTREIADRFRTFFPHEYPKLVERRPDLVDLMTLERAELRAMFETDDPGRCLEQGDVDALAQGSLDDLLGRSILRAPSASVVRGAQLDDGGTPPAARSGGERASVSRGPKPRFAIAFAALSEEAALVLEAADPGVPVTAERLALSWFATLPEPARSKDEEWKASTFAAAVLDGLRAGFFRAN